MFGPKLIIRFDRNDVITLLYSGRMQSESKNDSSLGVSSLDEWPIAAAPQTRMFSGWDTMCSDTHLLHTRPNPESELNVHITRA